MSKTIIKTSKFLNLFSVVLIALVVAISVLVQEQRPESARSANDQPNGSAVDSKAPAPSTGYSWKGIYVGGHIGYSWEKADTSFAPLPTATQFVNLAPTTLDVHPRGVNGGVQVGYNWQIRHLVLGGETDFSWTNANKTVTVTPIIQNNGTPFPGAGFIRAHQDTDFFGTLRGRVGAAFGRVLAYGTAGYAYGRVNYAAATDFRPTGSIQYPASFARTKSGWTGGGGVEIAINKHWSYKAEYLFYDLGKTSFTANPVPTNPPFQVAYQWQTTAHNFNTGVNYRF